MSSRVRVGIIGAGAAGTSVLDTLTPDRVDVTVFDGGPGFGPGRAYRPGSTAALVNLPASKMSLRPENPRHFADWLGEGQPEFVSRELYGDYLTEVFEKAAGRTAATTISEDVVAIERHADGYVVFTERARFAFDAIFLCVGNAGPADVYNLSGTAAFVPDPYPLSELTLPTEASVTVVGAGLSAVDAVLELERRGHKGRIRVVSRSGYLPGVRDTASTVVLQRADGGRVKGLAGSLRLLDLHRILAEEFVAQGIQLADLWREFRADERPAERLRRQLQQVQAGDPALPTFLTVAGLLLESQAWQLFDDTTRTVFLQRWHGLVSTLCAPMPVATAERLVALLDTGLLRISGGLTAIRPHHSGYTVTTTQGDFETSYVVNTVRPQPVHLPRRAADLLTSLTAAGLVTSHPLGGLRLDVETCAAAPGLYVLGELAGGELYVETTVLTAITHRVRQAVHHLLGGLPKGTS
ncbi:hypothetical protein E1263_15905 [Kribbella antibiotica]|uniref:FAD-dependent urate hydroxylase HpyO/Asp monooxygenase CreE-like FAD/NAD(P)-binding domain-containing protein n=1 Tax=Kribbella antibiotica TaxID=190195 RepID=A0A4R4ZMC0_9ACTN|nr:FAD/NAD(P)-binding protein [Kribbella antibiotica]TDD59256.1 hypothetical protein E1263_15905 [Kribbella antibiotica]